MAISPSGLETTPATEANGKRKQARQWRSARIQRFVQTQRRKREWYNFAEIAEMCSGLDESGVPNEAARENAYRNLERDVLDGDFQETGRSRVLYLHPLTVSTRMTPGWLKDVIKYDYDGHRGRSQYLPWCWCSQGAWERFASKHNLPISPPCFRPEHLATAYLEKTDDAAVRDGVPAEKSVSTSASGEIPPPAALYPEEKSAGGIDPVAIASEPRRERPIDSTAHVPELSPVGQPSPEGGQESLPLGRRVTRRLAREFAESYVGTSTANGRQPTQKGLEEAARTANLRGGRDLLRKALVDILGPDAIKRGRPRKKNSPK